MKPTNYEENIEYLKASSIPLDEKIDFLKSWIIKHKHDKVKLQQELDNIEFYGPDTPTTDEINYYGNREKAEIFKKRQFDSTCEQLKRGIKNKINSIESLSVKLEYYQELKQDEIKNSQEHTKNSNDKGPKPVKKEYTLSEMKEIAEKKWPKLKSEGLSENKAAEIISDEINNQRAPKTIKNWMHPEYL